MEMPDFERDGYENNEEETGFIEDDNINAGNTINDYIAALKMYRESWPTDALNQISVQ